MAAPRAPRICPHLRRRARPVARFARPRAPRNAAASPVVPPVTRDLALDKRHLTLPIRWQDPKATEGCAVPTRLLRGARNASLGIVIRGAHAEQSVPLLPEAPAVPTTFLCCAAERFDARVGPPPATSPELDIIAPETMEGRAGDGHRRRWPDSADLLARPTTARQRTALRRRPGSIAWAISHPVVIASMQVYNDQSVHMSWPSCSPLRAGCRSICRSSAHSGGRRARRRRCVCPSNRPRCRRRRHRQPGGAPRQRVRHDRHRGQRHRAAAGVAESPRRRTRHAAPRADFGDTAVRQAGEPRARGAVPRHARRPSSSISAA